MIKNYIRLLFVFAVLISCAVRNQGEEPCKVELDYWYMDNGDSTIQSIANYFNTSSSRYIHELYYRNGVLKSRCEYNGEELVQIFSLYSPSGDALNFGNFKNGNGLAIVYDDDGIIKTSGKYCDGNRCGWWKIYDYEGSVVDSIWYENGERSDMPGVKANLFD